jgi:hypothetical protein
VAVEQELLLLMEGLGALVHGQRVPHRAAAAGGGWCISVPVAASYQASHGSGTGSWHGRSHPATSAGSPASL